MAESVKLLLIWYGVISLLTLILFSRDKSLARRRLHRIPEAALLAAALFGGGTGALLGMFLFRHKTRKPLFRVLVPLFFLFQAALLAIACLKA